MRQENKQTLTSAAEEAEDSQQQPSRRLHVGERKTKSQGWGSEPSQLQAVALLSVALLGRLCSGSAPPSRTGAVRRPQPAEAAGPEQTSSQDPEPGDKDPRRTKKRRVSGPSSLVPALQSLPSSPWSSVSGPWSLVLGQTEEVLKKKLRSSERGKRQIQAVCPGPGSDPGPCTCSVPKSLFYQSSEDWSSQPNASLRVQSWSESLIWNWSKIMGVVTEMEVPEGVCVWKLVYFLCPNLPVTS